MEDLRFEENDVIEEVEEEYVVPEISGKGILGAIAIGLGAVTVGAGALLYKNRAKLEERRINNLRKKGYVISKPEIEVECEELSDEETE